MAKSEGPANSKYFYKSEMTHDRPAWAKDVQTDPRKLNLYRAWVRALAAEYTVEAMMTLVDLLKDADPQIRLRAATALHDRAWGKPETIHDPAAEAPSTDPDELLERIKGAAIDVSPSTNKRAALPPKRDG